MSFTAANVPRFRDLPKVNEKPHGCAWGLFDRDGRKDEMGTLNFLSAANVQKTASEQVLTGQRVQLDWSLSNMTHLGFGRTAGEHKLIDLGFLGFAASDDVLTFNTQQSSQWDGLRHFAHQQSRTLYNGLAHDDIHSGKEPLRLGIQRWVEAGGIAGRGVLCDWLSWYESTHDGQAPPRADAHHSIPLAEIKACLEAQGTELQFGDILLIRTGFVRWHDGATDEQRAAQQTSAGAIGLQQSDEMVEWLWDSHLSAIAADNPALEAWPPQPPILHEYLIAFWVSGKVMSIREGVWLIQ